MTSPEAVERLQKERAKHPDLSMQEWYRQIYLCSDHWKSLRERAKNHHGKACNRCGKTKRLDVHHKAYWNIYDVDLGDLEVICRSCHRKEHGEVVRVTTVVAPRHQVPEHRRPHGVPRKEWAAWLKGGKVGEPPKPVFQYKDPKDERNHPRKGAILVIRSKKNSPPRQKLKSFSKSDILKRQMRMEALMGR